MHEFFLSFDLISWKIKQFLLYILEAFEAILDTETLCKIIENMPQFEELWIHKQDVTDSRSDFPENFDVCGLWRVALLNLKHLKIESLSFKIFQHLIGSPVETLQNIMETYGKLETLIIDNYAAFVFIIK